LNSITFSEERNEETCYGYCNEYQPHAVKRMFDHENGLLYDMRWDEAGNLGQVSMGKPGEMFEWGRFLFWTEDSRMHAAVDEKYFSYYVYDHSGERRLKLTGINKQQDVNADLMATYTVLNEPTLYPSPYMVLSNKGYTKHYYAGTERVAARLGGGGLDAQQHVIAIDDDLQWKADRLFKQSLEQVNYRVLDENKLECIMNNEFAKEEFGKRIDGIPYQVRSDVKVDNWQFKEMVNSMLDDPNNGKEKEVFFYHSDHLGSASWITDNRGMAVQHIQYLPYGEPYINQHPYGYSERFTFTGKERDEETGYGYFGARYMDHELMTMWLSVDPMADKYPNISPYAYCAWNPVKLVDPDGNEAMTNDDWYKSTTKNSNGDYSVFWSPENAQTISVNGETYTNIGSSYIHSTEQGVTFYEQNSVTAFFPYLPVKDLSLSDKGTDFLFGNEGVRLKPYNDSKGYATIGVGHLIAKRNVTEQDKRNWSGFTQSDAINLFQQDVQSFENGIKSSVNVNLTQYQYDAIVSFAFNIGMGNFKKSEFLMSLNNGNYNGNLMMNFHRPPEIVPRRQREVNLFNDATY